MKISLAYINKRHQHFSYIEMQSSGNKCWGKFYSNKYDVVWDYNMAVFSDVLNKNIILEANILQLRPSKI